MSIRTLQAFAVAALLIGCGAAEGETPAGEACEHMASGPYKDVVASETAEAAQSASFPHHAVRIALAPSPDNAAENIGFVTISADEATEFLLFTSVDAPLAITDANGAEVAVEAKAAVSECTDVAVSHTVDFAIGTYTLRIGPTTETVVQLVVEEAAHDEGEEH